MLCAETQGNAMVFVVNHQSQGPAADSLLSGTRQT